MHYDKVQGDENRQLHRERERERDVLKEDYLTLTLKPTLQGHLPTYIVRLIVCSH